MGKIIYVSRMITTPRSSGREMCGCRWLLFVLTKVNHERRYGDMLDGIDYLERSRISGASVLPSSAHPPSSPLGGIIDECLCSGTFMHRMVPATLHHILWWLYRQVCYHYRHRPYPQVRKILALVLSSLCNRFFVVGAPSFISWCGSCPRSDQ